jgi:hypothetical protein
MHFLQPFMMAPFTFQGERFQFTDNLQECCQLFPGHKKMQDESFAFRPRP